MTTLSYQILAVLILPIELSRICVDTGPEFYPYRITFYDNLISLVSGNFRYHAVTWKS
ncbi:hypothetical protein M758_3G201000 [Ceratodon purpureus]|uniref:Uncharacterized protein n=1 Tax=Ceratodon purpureus TaxID=3225 RepID=A0A8T0IM28_CERPU|nr:hypothetical protein KC19_3G201800 [Ceratodon purpureus]KAG0623774.1 hypothetical protein M758_3G201000 [Ceratodon purpureus]